jgi:hypothetical protein
LPWTRQPEVIPRSRSPFTPKMTHAPPILPPRSRTVWVPRITEKPHAPHSPQQPQQDEQPPTHPPWSRSPWTPIVVQQPQTMPPQSRSPWSQHGGPTYVIHGPPPQRIQPVATHPPPWALPTRRWPLRLLTHPPWPQSPWATPIWQSPTIHPNTTWHAPQPGTTFPQQQHNELQPVRETPSTTTEGSTTLTNLTSKPTDQATQRSPYADLAPVDQQHKDTVESTSTSTSPSTSVKTSTTPTTRQPLTTMTTMPTTTTATMTTAMTTMTTVRYDLRQSEERLTYGVSTPVPWEWVVRPLQLRLPKGKVFFLYFDIYFNYMYYR